MQALESELGVALFDRGGRSLALTAAGARLAGYADRVLALVDEARSAVEESADEPAGELVIGGLETLCATIVPGALTRYRSRFPQVRVAVRQHNRGELHAALRRDDLDVCFTFGPPPPTTELVAETLFAESLVVIVPPAHPLAAAGTVDPADLAGAEFLVTEPGCGFREMYDRSLGRLGPDGPRIAAEVGSVAALSSCVASGMGCALLPELAVTARHRDGDVALLRLADPRFTAPVMMTWQRRWERKPSLAAFLKIARESTAA